MKTKEQLAALVSEGIDAYATLGLDPSSGALERGVNNAYKNAITAAGEDRAKNDEINIALAILQDLDLKKQHDEALGYGEKWKSTIDTSKVQAYADMPSPNQSKEIVDHKEVEAKQEAHTLLSKNADYTDIRAQNKTESVATKQPEASPPLSSGNNQAYNRFASSAKRTALTSQGTRGRSGSAPIIGSSPLTVAKPRPASTDQIHLKGDAPKEAILKNRTSWQSFTASLRSNGKELTENEKAAKEKLERSNLNTNEKYDDTIKTTLRDIRKNNVAVYR